MSGFSGPRRMAAALLLAAGIVPPACSRDVAEGARGMRTEACRPVDATARAPVPAGTYTIGGPVRNPEEREDRVVGTEGFRIDVHEVTNAEFAVFVAETGYLTVAERTPDPADHPEIDPQALVAGSAVFGLSAQTGYWWRFVPGASWRHPRGPGSGIEGLENHPVVHVAFQDALAYAAWAGADLPTEDEWEIAARGGGHGTDFAWGDAFRPGGDWRANTWQGAFPVLDRGEDGFAGLAPAGCYPANPFGLHDMIGNVWEWTASPFDATGTAGTIRGGSFLCSADFCARYRPAARQPQEWDFSASHIGFRTLVREPPPAPPSGS